MALTTLEQYRDSLKLTLLATRSLLNQSGSWNGTIARGNLPAAGTITGLAFTAAGSVPTDATAGSVTIPSVTGDYYLTAVTYGDIGNFGNPASALGFVKHMAHDRLFVCGSYSGAAATVNLAGQPSYMGRLPNGTAHGTQLWIESAGTSSTSLITVTYTNAAGTPAQSTSLSFVAGTASIQMPLASGDDGVELVESVTWGTNPSGDFNVVVVRPLFFLPFGPIVMMQPSRRRGIGQLPLAQIYDTSCIQGYTFGNINPVSIAQLDLEVTVA